jgi:L-alanine-DL-glutamate epimerase-like enolase superfamily enzyme
MKIKFDGTAETDVQRARAVIDEVGDEAAVRADANEAYDLETAIEVGQALEDLPLVHFEQPIPGDDLNSLKELTESTSTTIMADECLTDIDQVRKALALGAADRLKLKILRLGGVMNTRIALDYAQLHGIECVVGHGFCLSPAASAEIQLVASHANVFGAAETVGPLKMATEPFDPVIDMSSGSVTLSDEPGLGVELVDDELESCTTNVRTVE